LLPILLLYFPFEHEVQIVAPLVLDVPAGQFSHDSLGGSFPIVPIGHALNPDGSNASIFDPLGTRTDVDPPFATISPTGTLSHFACFGLD